MFTDKYITLEHGSGGKESWDLIDLINSILEIRIDCKDTVFAKNKIGNKKYFKPNHKNKWLNLFDDGALYPLLDKEKKINNDLNGLVFTTDTFTIDPLFFSGGDIGKLSICGTVNDLAVMGAMPIGLSLSLVIEEGFEVNKFKKIISSIKKTIDQINISIVTGDTKVIEKNKIDKIIINTSGIGLVDNVIPQKGILKGDVIIASGSLGDHEACLLAKRFDFDTRIKSDCGSILEPITQIKNYLTSAKDPTRGGLSAAVNDIAFQNDIKVLLYEDKIPIKKEAIALCEVLGLDVYSLACEGRFVCSASSKNAGKIIKELKKYDSNAKIIGEVQQGEGVYLQTVLGQRKLVLPIGKKLPRIC